jgi:hypothetical protein
MTTPPANLPDGSPPEQPAQPGVPDVADESPRPLEEQVPPTALATPSHVQRQPGEEIVWWQPGWRDAWRYVGYRWIFLAPALGLIALAVPLLRWPSVFSPFFVLEAKLFVFVVAIALTLAGFVVRRAVRARKEPFCIYCGYNLTGLPDNYRCPECGRPYSWRVIDEYRRDPHWFIERYQAHQKLPPPDAPFDAGPVRRRRRDGT